MSKIEISKEMILRSFRLNNSEVLNIFPYGSRVYKTHGSDSDYDFIVVMDKDVKEFAVKIDNMNVHLYSVEEFQEQVNKHKISALECIFLPKELLLKKSHDFKFDKSIFNKSILIKSISEKAKKDWFQVKKRCQFDNVWYAKKSLFHAFRIIDFGKQIIQHGKIENYSSSCDLWFEILHNPAESWESYEEQYQKVFDARMTEFKDI